MSIRTWGRALAGALLLLGSVGCGAEAGFSDSSMQADQYGVITEACVTNGVLARWEQLYHSWSFGARELPVDENGNAVVGHVVLMPIPNTPGDGTPGSVSATLTNRQSFFLPLFTLLGTSYTDGRPPDPFEPISIFQTLEIDFSVDGVTLVNQANVMSFFSKLVLRPPIPVNSPPFKEAIWLEGISILHPRLSLGSHTLKLDAMNTQPAFGAIVEYHNTWNLTVEAAP